MIDLTPIINALILLVAGAISSFLIPWLKRKIDESRMAELYSWVKIGVAAAEQIYRGVGKGEEKKVEKKIFFLPALPKIKKKNKTCQNKDR